MDIHDLYRYTGFICIAILVILIYVDYCSLENKKSKIWSSAQGDIQYYRNAKRVLKARIFTKILFILTISNMIYDYAVYRSILVDKFSWGMVIVLYLGFVGEGVISYKNDTRDRWTRISRYLTTVIMIVAWVLEKLLGN